MAKRVAGFGTTVFVEINELARRHAAVNLGQGAPDFDGPPEVLLLQYEQSTALALPFTFFDQLQTDYQRRRDRLIEALQKSGFKICQPSGSFFVMVDWRGVAPARVQDDYEFARWLTAEIGVGCIPASPFYQDSEKYLGKYFARFAVCKKEETLAAAAERLARLGRS